MEILKNPEDLQEVFKAHRIVIVQFGTESCAPCKALQNRIKIWNQQHPTIYVYVQGKLSLQQSGYFSLDARLEPVEKYRSLLEA